MPPLSTIAPTIAPALPSRLQMDAQAELLQSARSGDTRRHRRIIWPFPRDRMIALALWHFARPRKRRGRRSRKFCCAPSTKCRFYPTKAPLPPGFIALAHQPLSRPQTQIEAPRQPHRKRARIGASAQFQRANRNPISPRTRPRRTERNRPAHADTARMARTELRTRSPPSPAFRSARSNRVSTTRAANSVAYGRRTMENEPEEFSPEIRDRLRRLSASGRRCRIRCPILARIGQSPQSLSRNRWRFAAFNRGRNRGHRRVAIGPLALRRRRNLRPRRGVVEFEVRRPSRPNRARR